LAWHLFHQIVEGLAHIHGQGIIHRDLTPSKQNEFQNEEEALNIVSSHFLYYEKKLLERPLPDNIEQHVDVANGKELPPP